MCVCVHSHQARKRLPQFADAQPAVAVRVERAECVADCGGELRQRGGGGAVLVHVTYGAMRRGQYGVVAPRVCMFEFLLYHWAYP
jgi:hypothetical protein